MQEWKKEVEPNTYRCKRTLLTLSLSLFLLSSLSLSFILKRNYFNSSPIKGHRKNIRYRKNVRTLNKRIQQERTSINTKRSRPRFKERRLKRGKEDRGAIAPAPTNTKGYWIRWPRKFSEAGVFETGHRSIHD